MPAEHQRVLFTEEKARQTPQGPVGPRKGLDPNTPEPRGFFFIVKKNAYQDQSAGGAGKRHVFCAACPYRPAGPGLGRFYDIFQAATAGSIIVKERFCCSSSIQ